VLGGGIEINATESPLGGRGLWEGRAPVGPASVGGTEPLADSARGSPAARRRRRGPKHYLPRDSLPGDMEGWAGVLPPLPPFPGPAAA